MVLSGMLNVRALRVRGNGMSCLGKCNESDSYESEVLLEDVPGIGVDTTNEVQAASSETNSAHHNTQDTDSLRTSVTDNLSDGVEPECRNSNIEHHAGDGNSSNRSVGENGTVGSQKKFAK